MFSRVCTTEQNDNQCQRAVFVRATVCCAELNEYSIWFGYKKNEMMIRTNWSGPVWSSKDRHLYWVETIYWSDLPVSMYKPMFHTCCMFFKCTQQCEQDHRTKFHISVSLIKFMFVQWVQRAAGKLNLCVWGGQTAAAQRQASRGRETCLRGIFRIKAFVRAHLQVQKWG